MVDSPRKPRRKPAPELTPGTRLEHFQILEPLGHGGMGSVYAAYDLRLDRKVAIKVLAHDASGSELENRRQRLLREAQMMAKLSNPNVVPVYEVGVDRDTIFIAMEYVAGKTLGDWLDTKPSWQQIVDAFVQAGRGLAAAHEADIVHRDFKPANVLVDDRGHVRVVDFGIAQARGPAIPIDDDTGPTRLPADFITGDGLTPPSSTTPLTEEGSLVGTPAYMSPEQFRTATVDARSDQFSYCVALYEALFGKRPFKGKGKELAKHVTRGVMEKPDPRSAVPNWVTAVVLRGLATDPEQRFPSMTALVEALAHDPGRRRKRIAAIAAGTITLAAVATLVGWGLHARGSVEPCTGAESHLVGVWDDAMRAGIDHAFAATGAPFAASSSRRTATLLDGYRDGWIAMRTDACRATRVRGDQSEHVLDLRNSCLDRRLGELRALTTLLSGTIDRKTVERAVDAASALAPVAGCADTAALLQPGLEPVDPTARVRRAELRERLDRLRAGFRVRAKETLAPTRALVAEARAAADPVMIASALELQGAAEIGAGDLVAAEATLGEALRRARELGDADLFVTVAIDLVDALGEAGISTSREALGVVRVAESIVDDAHDPALAIRLAYEKADEYMTLAHADTALAIVTATMERARRTLGADHVQVFQLQSLYGGALARTGKHAEARTVYDTLIADETRVLGALHPMTALARLQRCHTYFEAEAAEPAASCFATAVPEAERVIDARDRELLAFTSEYAVVLLQTNRTDEGRRVLTAAYANVPDAAWTEKWFIASEIARSLGALEIDAGQFEPALVHCQRAASATEAKHAGPVDATCIGVALLGLHQPERALEALEAVRARVETADPMQMGAAPAQVGAWRFAYARALWEVRHQAAPARALAVRARAELGPGPRRDQLDAWLAKLP